jgi:hypothetical protein
MDAQRTSGPPVSAHSPPRGTLARILELDLSRLANGVYQLTVPGTVEEERIIVTH